ncbi:amino acid permease [Thermaerobacter subterraneus]|uniref:amino acid permease n=1 Tax=Thermaerobacter subterraneus TaxID=175696 RepID=UPI0031018B0E
MVRAARWTAVVLAGLYVLAVGVLLALIPARSVSVSASPLVAALAAHGLGTAARAVNGVLVTAILSTMLAVMFSLGRVVRSLAEDGMGPPWLVDRSPVPRRGILFSGAVMLAGVALGYLVPRQVYLFLVSAGGFALLLVYAGIVAAHWRLRAAQARLHAAGGRAAGSRPTLVPGFPWSNALVLAVVAAVLAGMPLVPGQGAGLGAGLAMTALVSGIYAWRARRRLRTPAVAPTPGQSAPARAEQAPAAPAAPAPHRAPSSRRLPPDPARTPLQAPDRPEPVPAPALGWEVAPELTPGEPATGRTPPRPPVPPAAGGLGAARQGQQPGRSRNPGHRGHKDEGPAG